MLELDASHCIGRHRGIQFSCAPLCLIFDAMASPLRWTITAAFLWCALLGWHGIGATRLGGESVAVFRAVYGFGYFAFGVAMLGAVSRLWPQAGAALWRPVMLASAASLALAQVWLVQVTRAAPLNLDTWMAAVLGLAVAALVPRLLPNAWLRLWLGTDRRSPRGG